MAFRWLLHTHADDILNYHTRDGAAGAANLRAIFGLDDRSITNLTAIAKQCRTEAEEKGWRNKAGFPEEVVRRFIGADMAYSHQTHGLPARGEFPLSSGYLQALLHDVDEAVLKGDDNAKGESLETVAFYLFSLLPGCVPKRNVLAQDSSYEDDIIVRDLYRENNIISDTFGRHFLVECKHRKGPIEVPEIGYFLFRIKMQHTKFGVMFSNYGITGGKNSIPERAARAEIMRAFHEDGSICVVITREHLDQLIQDEGGFFWLLLEKYEEYRFGRPKSAKKVKMRRT